MKKNWQKTKLMLENDFVKTLLTFVFFSLIIGWAYLSVAPIFSNDDPMFHIRFAEILREQGFGAFKDFHWLYFSKISINQSYFIYYNFLFYAVLIPFTYISPMLLGLKIYGVIFFALSFTILYAFLLKIKEKHAFLWTVSLFALMSNLSLVRFLTARPYTLAPALLLLEIYFLYRRKYFATAVLTMVYFYWHTATFFFPLLIAMVFFMFDGFYRKKVDWKYVGCVFFPTVFAVGITELFAPGLLLYMKDIIFGVYYDTIIGKHVNISEGSELYGMNVFDYLQTNSKIIILFVLALSFEVARYWKNKKAQYEYSKEELAKLPLQGSLFFLSFLFLFGSFLSNRNSDFFVFFSAVYIAMSWNFLAQFIDIKKTIIIKSFKVGAIVIVVYFLIGNALLLNTAVSNNANYKGLQTAAEWLKDNTKPKTVIFNTSWNMFPGLFHYNPNNYYIAGIEPRFLYIFDPKLYWIWASTSGKGLVCEQETCADLESQQKSALVSGNEETKKDWYGEVGNEIADNILQRFKSEYVVTMTGEKQFNDVMDNSDRFEKVFSDEDAGSFVYHVK